ncbi:MAG: hypothetical protein WKF28_10075 [Rubrobacteraceae bacterium]
MLDWVPEWGIAIALGLLGGVLRVVIGNVVVRPQRGVDDSGKRVYYLGSLSTVVVGAAAGFVAWALTTGELFKDEGFGAKTVAATILAGIAGTEILLNYVNRKLGVATSQLADQQANQETGAIAEPQARSIEVLTKNWSDCQERERKLQEDVNRLRKGGTLDN